MRFYFRRLFTFVCCLFAYTFMFGSKSFAKPGDYLAYYLGRDFKDESLKCCCCERNFGERYENERIKVSFCKYFGPACYVKYNEGEDVEDVLKKAKVFNGSENFKNLRKKIFDDAKNIRSYKEADVLVKTYLKKLNDLFCYWCIQFILLTFDTKEYHEFCNKPSEVVLPALNPYEDDTCAICQEDMKYLSGNLMCSQCKHCFHGNCIRVWLNQVKKCPICKAENSEFLIDVEANQGKKVKLNNCLFDRKYYSWLNIDKNRFCVFSHGNGKGGRNLKVLNMRCGRNQKFSAAVEWCYDEGRAIWVRYNNGTDVYEDNGFVHKCGHQ